jgi:4-amino-4-deoxy-L-arabinose transferase-like glycosyltransferase
MVQPNLKEQIPNPKSQIPNPEIQSPISNLQSPNPLIPASSSQSKILYALPYALIVLALLAFVGYFVVYNIYAFALFQFPFDYDQGEGFELMDTVLFSQGEWPYRDNSSYPFYSSNYPPLFHVIAVPLVWLFGPEYWTGRLVSYLGTLVTAGAIAYAVQRQGKRWWLSVLSGLAFLASNYVYHVGPLFRQHMFMVMFETLAVVLLTVVIEREERKSQIPNPKRQEKGTQGNLPSQSRGQELRGTQEKDNLRPSKGLFVLMLLLLFAGYTKQLAYATVAAVFLFLFLRQPKRAIVWAIPFAAVTGLIFLWINVATDGQWLLNTITANLNPFLPGQALGLFKQWFQLHTVITMAAAGLALYQLYVERLSAYSIWFVLAVVNSVSAGKWGAGESYFATAIAASCILSGLAFSRLVKWTEGRGLRYHLAALTVIPLFYLWQADKVFHMPTHTPTLRAIAATLGKPTEIVVPPQTSCSAPQPAVAIPYVDSIGFSLLGRPPNAQDTAGGIAIANEILEGETAAFSEEAGFNFYAGRDVVTNPTQLLNLYQNGQLELDEMVDMLNGRQFDTIILRAQFYPPPVLEAIGRHYETTNLIEMNGFVYCVLRPRS